MTALAKSRPLFFSMQGIMMNCPYCNGRISTSNAGELILGENRWHTLPFCRRYLENSMDDFTKLVLKTLQDQQMTYEEAMAYL